jgi:PKD repeat protein
MDASFVRAARLFTICLLVSELAAGPALGESTKSRVAAPSPVIQEIVVSPRSNAGAPRSGVGAPRSGSPVTGKPVFRGGSTATAAPAGTTPKRPNAQGPTTFNGTASLNFSPVAQYAGFATTASGTLTGGAASTTYTLNFGDGSANATITADANGNATYSFSHTYVAAGEYTAAITSQSATANAPTTIVSQEIDISAVSGSFTAQSAQPATATTITFNGTVPSTNTPTAPTITIAFGDGTTTTVTYAASVALPHTYAQAGTYALTATTATGTTIATGSITVQAAAAGTRMAEAQGSISVNPMSVYAGTSVTFTGTTATGSTDQGEIVFGDGNDMTGLAAATAYSVPHTYTTSGTFTASINEINPTTGALTQGATTTVTVSPLTATIGAATVMPGAPSEIMFEGAVPATNAPAPPNVTIVFGDGAQTTVTYGTATIAHTYAGAGTYTLRARVGDTTIATGTAVVAAQTATVTANPGTIFSGSSATIAFSLGTNSPSSPFTLKRYAATPQCVVAFGDGSTQTFACASTTFTHTYTVATNATETISVTPLADATNPITTTLSVVVPTATLGVAAPSIAAGASENVTIATNAITGVVGPLLTIDFGDGSAPTTGLAFQNQPVAHTYTTAGAYTITLSDAAGTLATANVNVTAAATVAPAATLTLSAPTILSGSIENITIMTNAVAGQTGPPLTLDFGDGSPPATNLPFENQVVSHTYARSRSGSPAHRYDVPGTYTLTLSDAAGTLATATLTVVTPAATLTVPNATLLVGQSESFGLTVGGLSGLAGPMLSISYGDGQSSVIPYANATLSHAYTQAGTFTVSVSDGTGTLATGSVTVEQPAAAIEIVPVPVILGSTANITVSLTSLGGLTGPAPLVLNFGDGTTTTLPSYTGASYQHTYAAVGTYSVTLTAPGFGTIGSNIVQVVQQNQALLVPPAPVPANVPADIVVNITPAAGVGVSPLRLAFGDGTAIIVNSSGTYPHAYPGPGTYAVTLSNLFSNLPISTQQIVVDGVTPRVPVGTIYSSSFTNSPVLAGGETHILIQYSLALPSMGTVFDPIEGYVDLLDAKGKLVRRSDDFEIEATDYSGPGVHTTSIPYDTPVDAHGTYQTRIILRSAGGGTISVGPPATLIIIGGPDPSISVNAQFHDTGAVEVGPHAGEPGATFDAGISGGFILPTYSGAISGLFDPISRKSDPLLTIKSGASPISAPDATPAPTAAPAPSVSPSVAPSVAPSASATVLPGTPPGQNYAPQPTAVPSPAATGSPTAATVAQQAFAVPDRAAAYATPSVPVAGPVAATSPPQPATTDAPVPHTYTDLGGRGQLTLPDALGGGSPLRGVDVLDTLGPVAYQVGYGYSSLGTADTSPERAAVADLTRTFGSDGSLRVAYFGRQDDPDHYPIMMGATGPLVTDSEALVFSAPTIDGFKLAMSGAVSDAHGLQSDYQTSDAADKLDLTYAHGSYNFAFDYHNAGALFAVGSGPGAASDRTGFASSSTIPLGAAVQVALNYNKDEARSAFSRQSDAGSMFSFTLPKSSTLSLGYKRDTQVAPTASTVNDSETAAIGTHLGIGTIALNASVSDARDLINAVNSAVTRTASFQYALQSNGHAFGFGVNATNVTAPGAAAPAVMATATPDPTVGDPTSMSAPGGVGSSMVAPVTGAGGNAQIGETMTYGFPFGGRVVGGAIVHGLELQLSASNTAQHSLSAGGYDEMLSSILSYHLTPHLALGLRGEYDWHGDIDPDNRHKASAIRIRLDLTQ